MNVIDKNLAIVTLHYEVKSGNVRRRMENVDDERTVSLMRGVTVSGFIALSSVKIKPEVLAAMPKPSPTGTPAPVARRQAPPTPSSETCCYQTGR
jgi:hypothetical protein